MNSFEILFKSKFKKCPLLATMRDEGRDRTVKIFYIGQQVLAGNALVGVYDGVDTWISPVKGCFQSLKDGYLASQIELAAQGKLLPEPTQRKQLPVLPVRKSYPHREMTHAS